MKINKRILIPVFATAMGLSVIGGISGAVAWYQYNSKVSTTFVGASVADTGVLRIGEKDGNDIKWKRDVVQNPSDSFRPVTFGKTQPETPAAFPADGWMYPEAGAGNGYYVRDDGNNDGTGEMPGWVKAQKGKDYVQFDLYFDAYQTDSTNANADEKGYTHVKRDVFLSKVLFRCLKTGTEEVLTGDEVATDAMRIQMDIGVDDETPAANLLLANDVYNTKLFGALDLDGNESADKYHKTPFNVLPTAGQKEGEVVDGKEIVYGNEDEVQVTKDINDYVVTSDSQSNSGATKLFSTTGDKDSYTHVVITVWLEGWAMLDSTNERAEWNANTSAGYDVQVALQFTTGNFRGNDLSPIPQPQPQP